MKMNSEYFVALAQTFEQRYGVEFQGIRQGADEGRARAADPVQDEHGRGHVGARQERARRLAGRSPGEHRRERAQTTCRCACRSPKDPFLDERLRVKNLPTEPQKVAVENAVSGAKKDVGITLFRKAGEVAGTRRAISEIVKWVNYVTGNRFLTIAADLSESINLEHGSLWGHYDPETNPQGTRIKAAIQEAGNVSTAIGLVSQSASVDPGQVRGRLGHQRHVRRLHAADVHAGARVESAEPGQQVQDGRAAHPGRPLGSRDRRRRTDALRHLRAAGLEALSARAGDSSQLLGLQRRGAGLLRGGGDRRTRSEGRHHHARSGATGFRRSPTASTFADKDLLAAAKGFYRDRDFTPGKPRHGYVVTQGSSSTVNLVSVLPKLEAAGINVKVVAAISEELFDRQPEAYRHSVLPPEAYYDLMVVTRRARAGCGR